MGSLREEDTSRHPLSTDQFQSHRLAPAALAAMNERPVSEHHPAGDPQIDDGAAADADLAQTGGRDHLMLYKKAIVLS